MAEDEVAQIITQVYQQRRRQSRALTAPESHIGSQRFAARRNHLDIKNDKDRRVSSSRPRLLFGEVTLIGEISAVLQNIYSEARSQNLTPGRGEVTRDALSIPF